jgi:hypothetical protein
VHDLARRRGVLHTRELDPLDVSDDGDPWGAQTARHGAMIE